MELIIIAVAIIVIFIVLYRKNADNSMNKFIKETGNKIYSKYAPYSYKVIRKKVKDLGLDYGPKQYIIQIIGFGGFALGVSYLYFYNPWITAIYTILAIGIVPYISYLRMKRVYSEYIFEQVQIYTTNIIMDFATTNSFVKSLESVYASGVLDDPVKSDVKVMIDMAYQNGSIDESIEYMNKKYNYYIVKNMHQLFLQITKEGALKNTEMLENMLLDIDMLVENVYRDRIDRKTFHSSFLRYGVMLYLMVMLVQYLLTPETYVQMLQNPLIVIMLHAIVIINSFFLYKGEKYYNENVGVE
ncbi:MAG TPA: hypothetical protein PLT65_00390 [Bacilli bacterium]|nr:hypothetical protein [Bacilli bacterium]